MSRRSDTAVAGLCGKIANAVFCTAVLVCYGIAFFSEVRADTNAETRAGTGNGINAANCGIAAGRDARGNSLTCNFGLTSEEIETLTRAAVAGATEPLVDRIVALGNRLGVSEATASALLKIVGAQPRAPGEDIAAVLTRVATKYKRLEARLASTDAENAVGRALVQQVRTRMQAGELQSAGNLLDTVTRHVAVLNGTCTRAMAMDVSIDAGICLPQLMNVEYLDKRQIFTFTTQRDGETAIISFAGHGPDQFHPGPNDAVQPIDKVIFTFQGSSDHLAAKGTCSFSNPYRGVPTTTSCRVRTSQGTFAGDFVSDGTPPDFFEAGAGQPIVNSGFRSLPEVIKGRCASPSHVASGRVTEDLTKKQSRFFCDSAIIMRFDEAGKHRLIQFLDSNANHSRILGFGGLMQDRAILAVKTVYLETARSVAASEGACKLFYNENRIAEIFCGAKVDEGDRRTVPIVTFEAARAPD